LVHPQLLAGGDVDCKYIIGTGGDVNHAALNEGLRLPGERRPHTGAVQMHAPLGLERCHVAGIYFGKRRIALVEDISAIRYPVADG